jgi:NADH:ubiquinone oxidoreductase subunit 5 (subunit L)/multisubunit Na+/H+ antiporter MnhA subunit
MTVLLGLILLPVVAGLVIWVAGDARCRARLVLALGSLAATAGLAVWAAADQPVDRVRWGSGLWVELSVVDVARGPVVLVAVVGLAVVVYSSTYGEPVGRARLVGLLVVFVGAMELLIVAGDFITLMTAWELVGLVSWGLIGHHWRTDAPPAAQAFLATRAGDLGLLAAAGAAVAICRSVTFADVAAASPGGGRLHLLVAGVVLAAAAKSAQLPFSPWLFSAMAGPTPASALLHSATMVAAGAYLLARLQPLLDGVGWFGPLVIAVGLTTAVAGGCVAYLQTEAKRLLAASTSAHYGLMFVAVGAGYPAVAIAHLLAHALCKAMLFVAAGVAIDERGTGRLDRMRLARRLPVFTGLTAVGTLALAGVPPLAMAWTKEQVAAAASVRAAWLGAAVVVAGGLSALYATRFQLAAFGRGAGTDERVPNEVREHLPAALAMAFLGTAGVVGGVVWSHWGEGRLHDVTGGALTASPTWITAGSLAAVGVGIYAAVVLDRRGMPLVTSRRAELAAEWLALPRLTRRALVDPVLAMARGAARADTWAARAIPRAASAGSSAITGALARADRRVVGAGARGAARFATWSARIGERAGEWTFRGAARGVAALAGAAGRDLRRTQTGQAHHYYAGLAAGVAILVAAAVLWR